MRDKFRQVAQRVSETAGSPAAFITALIVILIWAITGPFFGFSDTWQLVINTGTTITTFLMVFLIQNTQNRDSKAMHLKLDELIYHQKGARNTLIDLEDLTEEELETLRHEFEHIRKVNENLHESGHAAISKEIEKRKQKKKSSHSKSGQPKKSKS